MRAAPAGLASVLLPAAGRCTRRAADRRRRSALPAAAARQVAVAVPQPQPLAPEPRGAGMPPKWALAAGALAVAGAVLKVASSLRQQAPPAAAPPPPAEAGSPALQAAVRQAGEALGSTNGAAATAAALGPVLLAAETGGVVDETPSMSLEQLRATATELYMLIQQVGACVWWWCVRVLGECVRLAGAGAAGRCTALCRGACLMSAAAASPAHAPTSSRASARPQALDPPPPMTRRPLPPPTADGSARAGAGW
jgi:hypothetical protein